MEYFMAVLIAVAAAGAAYVTSNKTIADRIPLLCPAEPDAARASKELPKTAVWIITAVTAVLSYFAMLCVLRESSDKLGVGKMAVSMLCMTGAACVDYREHRIPNIFPGIMAVGGILFLAAGVVFQVDGAVAYITASVVAAVCCLLLLFLASALTKQGIGAGDIKLICALALMTGVYTVVGTMFFGAVLCGITAIAALVTRKMDISGALPFGPFLYVGFMLTVLTGNF